MMGFATLRRLDDDRRTRGIRYVAAGPILLPSYAVELRELGVELLGGDLAAWVGVPARLEMDDGCWFEGHVTGEGGFRARLVREARGGEAALVAGVGRR
jgi:hypothetical protein